MPIVLGFGPWVLSEKTRNGVTLGSQPALLVPLSGDAHGGFRAPECLPHKIGSTKGRRRYHLDRDRPFVRQRLYLWTLWPPQGHQAHSCPLLGLLPSAQRLVLVTPVIWVSSTCPSCKFTTSSIRPSVSPSVHPSIHLRMCQVARNSGLVFKRLPDRNGRDRDESTD